MADCGNVGIVGVQIEENLDRITEVSRSIAECSLIVAIGQGTYAFAPAAFGLIRELAPHATQSAPAAAPILFAVAALIQGLAICAFLAGRRR